MPINEDFSFTYHCGYHSSRYGPEAVWSFGIWLVFGPLGQQLVQGPDQRQVLHLLSFSPLNLHNLTYFSMDVIADSLFPTADTKQIANSHGISLTFSQNAAHLENVTRALDFDLPKGHYRVMAKLDSMSRCLELQVLFLIELFIYLMMIHYF
jgi:hypothetical protein